MHTPQGDAVSQPKKKLLRLTIHGTEALLYTPKKKRFYSIYPPIQVACGG